VLSKSPTKIGNKVFIGAGVSIDSSTIEDSSFIGEGSMLLAGSKIGKQSILAAGSVLPMGSSVPAGQVWSGSPAAYLRDVTAVDIEAVDKLVRENRNLASAHARELSKSWLEIEEDKFDYEQTIGRNEYYYKRLTPEVSSILYRDLANIITNCLNYLQEMSFKLGEQGNHTIPGRIFDSPLNTPPPEKK